ncbi:MAG: hypothetical protein KC912_06235 [Proteobacteria bacterium]|nr:hypothetical protein [Pseudomonadota bacterium]
MLALMLVVPVSAAAQAQPKRSRAPLSALEVERGLVLPKGWVEIEVVHASGKVRGEWTSTGTVEPVDAEWTQHRQVLRTRFGVAPRLEAFAFLPIHQAHTDGFQAAVGDAGAGVRWEVFSTDLPTTSLAIESGFSGASGPEPRALPGRYERENPLTFNGGTPSVWLAMALRRQVGPLVVGLRAGRRVLFPGVVGHSVGEMDLGDQWRASGTVLLQGGPLVLAASPSWVFRGQTRFRGQAVPDSEGHDVRLLMRAEVHVSRGFEVGFLSDLHLRGEDAMLYPIDDGTPPAVHRFGGLVRVRL